MHDLSGRTILLTGASKGIGAATAEALGAAGAHVVAHYGGDRAGAEAATAAIPADRKLLVQADLADLGAVRGLWREAVAWRGRVDVLVNNAAVMLDSPLAADDDQWDAAWARSLDVNVKGPASLLRDATRHHLERGGGVIVTISSWAAQRGAGNPDLTAYSASKAAIKAATQTIARAHAVDGVLAYVVAPGIVRTQMSEVSAQRTGGEEALTASLAMKEWVPPSDLADLVCYLATGRCRHLTGATLDVNGASYVR
ncbi:SDR family NAD(P)-dependent oxidoreductase [Conexibacter arvalis]|uniref:NAD(P)-dependent dehydrogenase (Short-subunit alcohol dehydrogenase family) n=1 Tax=Conexibacter arvalis TaxID=912552 RepID=A0A840IAR2_9ACTN|nr:SDR family oxidoreductase [Conexibacter arvalis]MBB4661341.1 NAD(P)-dependent dehydrogenase (short-subunit alcohol dehydrogenase family) [Conexibacter arvalis]